MTDGGDVLERIAIDRDEPAKLDPIANGTIGPRAYALNRGEAASQRKPSIFGVEQHGFRRLLRTGLYKLAVSAEMPIQMDVRVDSTGHNSELAQINSRWT